MDVPGEVTSLLRRFRSGDDAAGNDLLPLVYRQLHQIAQRAIAGDGHTLQATALLHEAWIRLEKTEGTEFENRDHFFAVAARAMRSVIVDRARKRSAAKRGGGMQRIDLDQIVDLFEERSSHLLALDEALDRLGEAEPELARIVELRFFGGMKHPEIAKVLGIPLRRVERGWSTARSWLHVQLDPGSGDG